MPELKLHQPLPEVDTARLRPGLRQRPRLVIVPAPRVEFANPHDDEQTKDAA